MFFQPVLIWVYFILCDVAWLLCTVDIKAMKVLMCVSAVVLTYGRNRNNKKRSTNALRHVLLF